MSARHESCERTIAADAFVLKVRLSNSRYALHDFRSGSNGIARTRTRGRHRLVFRAADFHFRDYVFCDDSATKEAAGTTTEINRELENG